MLELRAFSGLTLVGVDPPLQPKRLALLCYLALARPRGLHRRDSLLALFWPELDTAHARQSLRQALTALRSVDEGLLMGHGDEEVGLRRETVQCDVVAFEEALERGDLSEALDGYSGPFLKGFFLHECPEFERWVDTERTRLQAIAAQAAWRSAEQELPRNPAGAVHWARRAFSFQPEDERGVQSLIRILDQAGDRAGAIREYESFARRLKAEYGAEPAPETRALVDAVRSRRELTPGNAPPKTAVEPYAEAPRPGSRSRLVRWAAVVGAALAFGALWVFAPPAGVNAPQANSESHLLYQQGLEYATRPGRLRQNWEIAQQFYERALALDPGYALAHAALADVHGRLYWYRYDPSERRLAQQRTEAETAAGLAPDLPQAHVAMGTYLYYRRGKDSQALDHLTLALRGLPDDPDLRLKLAWVYRRVGKWEEFFDAFENATRLAPRNADIYRDLGGLTNHFLHRYPDAVLAFNRALTLAPDLHNAAVSKGWTYVAWQGQMDTLRAALRRLPGGIQVSALGSTVALNAERLFWERQADSLLALLRSSPSPVLEGQFFYVPSSLYAGWAHRMRGDRSAASAAFDSARVLVDSMIRELPDDQRLHAARGLIAAALGRRAEALAEARWLKESVIYGEDHMRGSYLAEDRARILAQAGEVEAALTEIRRLVTGPSMMSVQTLRLDPLWDPIRQNPQFQALVTR